MKTKRPKHGCARCIWWGLKSKSCYGRCALYDEDRYYQCGPCTEYETDPDIGDEIDIERRAILTDKLSGKKIIVHATTYNIDSNYSIPVWVDDEGTAYLYCDLPSVNNPQYDISEI